MSSVTFSDVSYTSDSVTFTISGSLTTQTDSLNSRFSIVYNDEMVAWDETGSFARNSWTDTVFDDADVLLSGRTGIFSDVAYSWIS
ncbi:MAG: hypothetical protein ACPGNV_12355 [Mangrovicoccus sp.]